MINISTITPGQMDTRPFSNMHVGQTTTIKRGGVIWLYYKFHFLSWQELVKFCAKNTRNVNLIYRMISRYRGRCVGGGWWYAVIQKFQSYYIGLVSNIPQLKNWEVMSEGGSFEYRKMSCYGYLWWILVIGCTSRLSFHRANNKIGVASKGHRMSRQFRTQLSMHTVIYLLWTNCPIWIRCHFWCILFLLLLVSIWMRMRLTCIYLDGSDVVCRRQLLIAASVC